MDQNGIFRLTGRNRRLAADLLAGLSHEQWEQPSLCAGWSVRDAALAMAMAGRVVALDDLIGEGVAVLRGRLVAPTAPC